MLLRTVASVRTIEWQSRRGYRATRGNFYRLTQPAAVPSRPRVAVSRRRATRSSTSPTAAMAAYVRDTANGSDAANAGDSAIVTRGRRLDQPTRCRGFARAARGTAPVPRSSIQALIGRSSRRVSKTSRTLRAGAVYLRHATGPPSSSVPNTRTGCLALVRVFRTLERPVRDRPVARRGAARGTRQSRRAGIDPRAVRDRASTTPRIPRDRAACSGHARSTPPSPLTVHNTRAGGRCVRVSWTLDGAYGRPRR